MSDAQVGYHFTPNLKLRLDVFNLFNQQTNDITYRYDSRLTGEAVEGVTDNHIHPGEPRSFPGVAVVPVLIAVP